MARDYWLEKWRKGDILFHESEVHPALPAYMARDPLRCVFVPLCGKSLDMRWLLDQGHEVVGAELSPIACRDFFDENKLPCTEEARGSFVVYRGERVTLWCGDVFQLPPEATERCTFLYDRAALIALSPDDRVRYGALLSALPRLAGGLVVAVEHPHSGVQGPPYSVGADEVRAHFEARFQVDELERQRNTALSATNAKFASVRVLGAVYRLTRKTA